MLLQQIHSSDIAIHHELGGGLARRHRRRLGNPERPGRRRGAGAVAEELRVGLSRTLEYAARACIPVHRPGDADGNRSRPEQAVQPAQGIAMPSPGPTYALEISHLKKAFGGLVVTQDVSLAIRPGERRLIIGPNGAGKTTLFNQISGDMRPTSGQVRLFASTMRLAPYQRAHSDYRALTRSSRCSIATRSSTTSPACSACGHRAGRWRRRRITDL